MKTLLCLALTLLAVQASAANFSGKWAITRQGGRGGPVTTILVLNQAGNEITGEVSPPRGVSTGSPANTEVLGGKVDGETVSFYLWTGLDKPVKNFYQGKLSGDDIVFTVTLDAAAQPGPNQPRTSQVTAKRLK